MSKRKIKYDKEALKRSIVRCDKNVELFQDAIRKEYENKAKLRALIKEIEEEEKL